VKSGKEERVEKDEEFYFLGPSLRSTKKHAH